MLQWQSLAGARSPPSILVIDDCLVTWRSRLGTFIFLLLGSGDQFFFLGSGGFFLWVLGALHLGCWISMVCSGVFSPAKLPHKSCRCLDMILTLEVVVRGHPYPCRYGGMLNSAKPFTRPDIIAGLSKCLYGSMLTSAKPFT